MAEISDVGSYLSKGWSFLTSHTEYTLWGFYRFFAVIVAALVLFALAAWPAITALLGGDLNGAVTAAIASIIPLVLISIVACFAMVVIGLYWLVIIVRGAADFAKGGDADLNESSKNAWGTAGAYLLQSIAIGIPTAIVILILEFVSMPLGQIASYLISWIVTMMPYALIAGGLGISESISKGWEIFNEKYLTILGVILAELVIGLVGMAIVIFFGLATALSASASIILAVILGIITVVLATVILTGLSVFSHASLTAAYVGMTGASKASKVTIVPKPKVAVTTSKRVTAAKKPAMKRKTTRR